MQYNFKWNLLRYVTADCGGNICGKEKAIIEQILKDFENVRCL